jgi:hypothetical protein
MALEMALSLGVTLAVSYGFAQIAHPYWTSELRTVQLSPSLAAKLHAQHHEITVVTLVLAGVETFISQLAVLDARPSEQAITCAGFPLALSAGASLGIALTPHHTVGLVVLAFVSGAGAYARRLVALLGTRAAAWGTSLVAGYLAGFLGGQALPLHEFYWYVAIVSLAAAVNLGLLLAVYNPLAVTRVPLLARSFRAQGQNVLKAAGSLLVAGDQEERERRVRPLDSGLARPNKNAVLTDAQLADPRSRISARVAEALHESLFDGEIVLSAEAPACSPLCGLDGPLRAQVAGWLSDLRSGHAPRRRDLAGAQWSRSDRTRAGSSPGRVSETTSRAVRGRGYEPLLPTALTRWARVTRHPRGVRRITR